MKTQAIFGMLFTLILLIATPVMAKDQGQSASATWGNSVSVFDSSAAYNNAMAGYLMRHRIGPYSSSIYNDNSTNYTTNTTNCSVAGGCQTGGTMIAINGYSATNITGNGNTVTTGISTIGTHQKLYSGTSLTLINPIGLSVGTITETEGGSK